MYNSEHFECQGQVDENGVFRVFTSSGKMALFVLVPSPHGTIIRDQFGKLWGLYDSLPDGMKVFRSDSGEQFILPF